MTEETLKQVRDKYDQQINFQFNALTNSITELNKKVDSISDLLIANNLPEMKKDVQKARDTLLEFNLSNMSKTISSHDKLFNKIIGVGGVFMVVIYPIAIAVMNHYLK